MRQKVASAGVAANGSQRTSPFKAPDKRPLAMADSLLGRSHPLVLRASQAVVERVVVFERIHIALCRNSDRRHRIKFHFIGSRRHRRRTVFDRRRPIRETFNYTIFTAEEEMLPCRNRINEWFLG